MAETPDVADGVDMPNPATGSLAIAHKDYDVRGGGEVLAEQLAACFDAPLHVGHRNSDCEPDDSDLDIREIPLSRIETKAIEHGGLPRSIVYMLRWQAASLESYDTVITSGNEPLWWVPKDVQTVLAYTHSTPRWMYDLYYSKDFSGVRGRLDAAFNLVQRTLYESNVRRPDLWVCNSEVVARRVKRYWNIPTEQIEVVYPPVAVDEYSPDDAPTGEYYCYVGRLSQAKRVGEIVRALSGTDWELVVAGTGPAEQRLRSIAGDNVRFEGFVSETRKQKLMSGAKAGIFNALNEDFGMVPVEFLAAGTPVLTVREGMPEYTIVDGDRSMEGVRGYSYERGATNLAAAVRRFETEGVSATPAALSTFAEQFSKQAFCEGMAAAVEKAQHQSTVSVSWEADHRSDEPHSSQSPTVSDGGEP
jgi:glycosyltransferase involved in cell wall biosynthesis